MASLEKMIRTKSWQSNLVVPLLWFGVVTLIAYTLLPIMTRSHLEGFTYLTETMSLLLPDIAATDPLWDIGSSYFYLSRPGTIWLMAPLSKLVPGSGYTLLMWLAMPVFLFGMVVLSGVSGLWREFSGGYAGNLLKYPLRVAV